MRPSGIYQRIVDIARRIPDRKHDTRHLECGHSVVVPRARLHPMTSRCPPCEGEKNA